MQSCRFLRKWCCVFILWFVICYVIIFHLGRVLVCHAHAQIWQLCGISRDRCAVTPQRNCTFGTNASNPSSEWLAWWAPRGVQCQTKCSTGIGCTWGEDLLTILLLLGTLLHPRLDLWEELAASLEDQKKDNAHFFSKVQNYLTMICIGKRPSMEEIKIDKAGAKCPPSRYLSYKPHIGGR